MTATPLVSVVLPVHDQADHIAPVVRDHAAALEGLGAPFEVLLVVNGCRDRSAEVCAALARELPAVRVLESAAGGWGLAVRMGLAAATGDLLAYTNSARTEPGDLAAAVRLARAHGPVVVKATRKIREGRLRRLGGLLYNLQCRALFDLPYWDVNGTPKVFPREFALAEALRRDDDLIDLEFLALCRRRELPVLEVPLFSTRRFGGRSTTTLRSALRLYAGAFALRRADPRLRP